MTVRKKAQKSAKSVRKKINSVVTDVRGRSEVGTKIIETTAKGAAVVGGGISKGYGKVIKKGSEAIGFDKYREELDQALQEALRVITVQELRIRELEELIKFPNV